MKTWQRIKQHQVARFLAGSVVLSLTVIAISSAWAAAWTRDQMTPEDQRRES